MIKFRLARYVITAVIILLLPVVSFWLSFDFYNKNELSIVPEASAANSGDFGVASFVSSLPNNTHKQTIVSEMSKLGVGWGREEYSYSDDINFAPYDVAYSKLHAANKNILGLLTYSPGKTHAQWRNYVTSIVNHFPGVTAWEIMNEADNYLSPSDYVTFLKEAHTIIKAKNSSSKIILSGITSRVESPNFWNGVSQADGWGYFDAVGLHIYHDGDPSQDSYNNGSLGEEVQHAIDSINNNGGGKKIWVTEFGWDSGSFGEENQANWLSSGLETVHNFSEVEKIFIFRMYETNDGLGLLRSNFTEKPSFNAVKDAISRIINGQAAIPVVESTPEDTQSEPVQEAVAQVDSEKSMIRLDQLESLINGQKNYRIVVLLKDENDNILKGISPTVTLEGVKTELTDFIPVGDEWFAYVTSSTKGEVVAKISADGKSLGTLKMIFSDSEKPSPQVSPSIIPSSQAQVASQKISLSLIIFYLLGGLAIIGLLTFIYFRRKPKKLLNSSI